MFTPGHTSMRKPKWFQVISAIAGVLLLAVWLNERLGFVHANFLQLAAARGSLAGVETLIALGSNPNVGKNGDGPAPFFCYTGA